MANMSKEEGMDGTQWMEKNTTSIKNSEEGKSWSERVKEESVEEEGLSQI